MRAALLALALLALPFSAQATTILFDDFEANPNGLNSTPAGWAVTQGTVDTIGTGFFQMYGPGRYIDMNGSTGQAGRIERQVNVVAGQTYQLSFSYGYNTGSGANETLGFGVGGFSGSIGPAIIGTVTPPTFNTYAVQFVAAVTGSVTLHFADIGNTPGDGGGAVIDNVRLSAVPVPAAASLLLLALGGLGLAARRKRA
jgi:hypothetical protein